MKHETITTVRFYNYWKLLQHLAPDIDSIIVFNRDGNFIWQSNATLHPQMDRITVLVRTFQKHAKITAAYESEHELNQDTRLHIISLQDDDIEQSLVIAQLIRKDSNIKPISANYKKSIALLNKTLLTEYSLIHKVIEKEQELNSLTDELTHRYEELNLIYSADDHVQNISHGRELLKNIVENASNFMDVDLVVALLPEKNVTITHSKQGGTPRNYLHLIETLQNDIYQQIKINKKPIVINHFEDSKSYNLFIDMPYKMALAPMLNADNDVIGMMGIFNNVNRIDFTNSDRNLLEVLTNKATNIVLLNFDPLTGLENNHSFEMILLDTLKQTWVTERNHAVAHLDIDRMSVINDLGGLEIGDKLLKKVASILTEQVRSYDTVARLSGDRFAVLLKNCDLQEALLIMKKVDTAVSEIELNLGQEVHDVSISIGIAPITADIKNVSNINSNAESALKAAKERGRNKTQVFKLDDSDLLRRKEMVKWVSRVQTALRENRFEIHAQLILPLNGKTRVPHYEILLRLRDKEGQIVSPGLFLPAAENFYLMPKIDRWVIENTFKILSRQPGSKSQPACEISINLSGQTLSDLDLAQYIEDMLQQYPVDPKTLCFEVTESATIANMSDAKKFIAAIKELGCKFSLDDFGTGQSSFSYLKNLTVDYLKIDGSFVRNMIDDPVSNSMVSAFNQIAHAMHLKTIAEFVENKAIVDALETIGIDYAQGYHYDKPEPLADKLALINPAIKNAGNE